MKSSLLNSFKGRLAALLLLVPLALAACDDDATSPRIPASLMVVEGSGGTATVGSTVTLTVQVEDNSGNLMPEVPVQWQVDAGDGSLSPASSTTNSDGRASTTWTLGTKAGAQSVRASVDGTSPAIFQVMAQPGPLEALAIEPSELVIPALREEVQLSASGVDAYGNAIPGLEIEWSSLDESIATVSENGLVTSFANGKTRVVATSGELADTVDVEVKTPAPLAEIVITAEQDTILVEGEVRLTATGIDEEDDPYTLGIVKWSTSDETTATIDEDGYVTSHAGGTVTIKAESEGVVGEFELVVRGRIHNSSISADETWTERDSPHWVTNSINVTAALTIEAGAVVEFEKNVGMVFGSSSVLLAKGTAESPILFTGTDKQPGWWRGIHIDNSSDPNNIMDHVIIEYGGGSAFHNSTQPANLTIGRIYNSGRLTLKNSTLRHSKGYGLHIHFGSEIRGSEGNALTQNASGAASLFASEIHQLDDGSTYTGNTHDHVLVTGRVVESDGTWQALDVPYRMAGTTNVRAVLTIDAGARFEFLHEAALVFEGDGSVSAIGTQEDPIRFTGTDEQPGWWQGIAFNNSTSPNNVMEYVEVSYGGGKAFHNSTEPANISVGQIYNVGRLKLKNSTLRASGGYGLFVYNGSRMDGSESNSYQANKLGAAAVYSDGIRYLDDGSMYSGNTVNVVDVIGGTVDADVTWQALDVPYRMSGKTSVNSEVTIDPGANFAFKLNASLVFESGSTVKAVGTAADPITFTGTDTIPGWWQGIFLNNSDDPNNIMDHVIIEYGGGSAFHNSTEPANLTVGQIYNASRLTLRNSTLRFSEGYGLFVHSNSTINADVCTVNTIEDNQGGQCRVDS